MIAVQRPLAFFSPSPAFSGRPSHSRNPSAPVVIRPTHTPGLLSLSKPAQQSSNRSQPVQQYARAPRSSAKGKFPRSAQAAPAPSRPLEDVKKSSEPKARTDSSSTKASKSVTAVPSPEKSVRGRQPSKASAKDKADRSSPSPVPSSLRSHARRFHQPSPSPNRIPQQAESHSPINPFRAQSFEQRKSGSNLFDPFIVNSSSGDESDSTPSPSKAGQQPPAFRAPPPLAASPSGKLARRRKGAQSAASQTPSKAVPVPRSKDNHNAHAQLAHSEPTPSAMVTPKRIVVRPMGTGLPLANWDEFPVCDETVSSPPSTPVRPSASVARGLGATWQQAMLDDGPRTAPLSSTFSFPFAPAVPCATPSPAHRRRHHHRVPSEGVFAMSTDEESSTDSSDELKKAMHALPLFGPRTHMSMRTPSPPAHDISPASFYAGSVFQNSPSPDDLPVPAFRA